MVNPTHARHWTQEEEETLRRLFTSSTYAEIGALLGRSEQAVRNRCYELRMRKAAPDWTDEDLAVLVEWYRERDGRPLELDDLAQRLGRLKSNICRKARAIGLTNNARTWVEKIDGHYPSRVPMFATAEERSRHLSQIRKEYIARLGHPRGALGMKHTPETRAKIAVASQRASDARSPEERTAMARKSVMTRIEKYGSAGPRYVVEENAYSRAKGGKREDLDDRYFRSAWEANYARYLNWLVENGEIASWEYEADTFVFHGETRGAITYRPDFKVTERDGSVAYHEVKGWMDGPSKTRLARMKKYYPDVKVIVIGEDEYRAIAKWRGLIPEWESGKDSRCQ